MQVDLYWSHDYAIQSLTGSSASKSMRQNSESPLYSNSIGGRFGFTFPSGMGIKTGFNVSKVRRSFTYMDSDGVGMDTSSVGNTLSTTNTYTYVDIPLLFTYEMSGFGPFYYNVNAGVLFNMTFAGQGKFISPEGSIVDFTRGTTTSYIAYEKTVGTSLYASFGLHYVINDLFDLVLEPNIRYSLGPITTNTYPLDEKFTTVGLITGLRYKF